MKKILIVVMLCFTMNAQAQFISGNKLVSLMREYEKASRDVPNTSYGDAGRFQGYVAGVHDAFGGVAFCTPPRTTNGQVEQVVVQYINAHPARWAEPANLLVVTALNQAFPCTKK